ncbi:MAG: cell division protein FtsQ/DivIB [bacterium]
MIAQANHKIYKRKVKLSGRAVIRLISVVGLGSLAYLIWFGFLGNSYFQVRKVKMIGNREVSRKTILRKLRIDRKETLVTLDADEWIKRIESIPAVKSARLIRGFPNTVYIKVTERIPYAWGFFQRKYYLLDREGVVLKRSLSPGRYKLPVMKGFFRGSRLKPQIEVGIRLARELERAGISGKISNIDLHDIKNVTLSATQRKSLINIGDTRTNRQWVIKLKKMLALSLDSEQTQNYIDLRFKEMAVVRPL